MRLVAFLIGSSIGISLAGQPKLPAHDELRALADSLLAINTSRVSSTVWPDLSDSTRRSAAARVDGVAMRLGQIDRKALTSAGDRLLYDNLAEAVAGARGTRVCRNELWSGTSQFNGWHVTASNWARSQRMDSATRPRAFATLEALPSAIAAERGMLQRGLDSGYTASAAVISAVIKQIDELLPDDPTKSPLWAPAQRAVHDDDRERWRTTLTSSVYPAARAFRGYLERDYRPRARTAGSLSGQRDGTACYRAGLRAQTSVDVDLDATMREARAEVDKLVREMTPLVQRLTNETDVIRGINRLRAGAGFTFESRDSILPAYRAMTKLAESRIGRVVSGFSPESLDVIPYPEFQEKAGLPPQYQRASLDGSRPAQFLVNLGRTERMSVANAVSHEAYPGHHLQRIAERHAPVVHPVMRTLFVGGFTEGWGIYSETLADEMGLYATDLDRAGYYVHLLDVAVAYYLDVGYHTRGWTRDAIVDTMMTLGGRPRGNAEAYADRHAATPGQLATYYIGFHAIADTRRSAEQALGAKFDAPRFHHELLKDGTLTLASMEAKIDRWIAENR
jgi:uncharacterized protein (DUF885 family)